MSPGNGGIIVFWTHPRNQPAIGHGTLNPLPTIGGAGGFGETWGAFFSQWQRE